MSVWRSTLGFGVGSACTLAGIFVSACASDDATFNLDPERTEVVIPERDAGDGDGSDGSEACTGDDCAFFPAECEPGALCPSGLFEAAPSSGVDWRTWVSAIRGRSATDAWLVGTVGLAARFDGTTWKTVDVDTENSLRFLWLAEGGELAFGTPDAVFTRGLGAGDGNPSPDGWVSRGKVTQPAGASRYVTTAWGRTGSRAMWVATDSEVWRMRLDDDALTTAPGLTTSVCSSLPCKHLRGLDGASSNVVWGVGETGAAIRVVDAESASPTIEVSNPLAWLTLNGIWAVSDTEAWAVGAQGTVIHNVGATFDWKVADVPTRANLYAVAGSSSSDVWAVGAEGVVLHYDGTTWSRVKVAGMGLRRPELRSVWVPEPGKVWIGGQGVLLSLGDKP
ncbi:MAG: hypothetical protein J0I07_31330 [Myxococcales bacterium]|nr:hypothetical protein [Myxococcales bacterium]